MTVIIDGDLYSWGQNSSGSTGTGTLSGNVFTATQIGVSEPVWDVVSGGDRERIGLAGGKLFAWGLNTSGRLGLGDSTNRSSPTQIGTDTDWVYVSSAGFFTFAIKSDGTLWSWGTNFGGQLGQGDTSTRNVPTQVGSANNWSKVYCSWYNGTTYAINSSGELYACGSGNGGVLGLGDTVQRTTLERVGTASDWQEIYVGEYSQVVFGLAASGLYAWGNGGGYGMLGIASTNSALTPTLISASANWVKIATNQEIVLALNDSGQLYGWGANFDYTLSPTGAALNDIVEVPTLMNIPEPLLDVSCQTFHPMVYATSARKLYAWGTNESNAYAPGFGGVLDEPSVLLDYTSENKQPLIVAQSSSVAIFATKTP